MKCKNIVQHRENIAFKEGKKEAIAEEIKFLKYLIDSYFLICVGNSPQTPRTDILLRIKTLRNKNGN